MAVSGVGGAEQLNQAFRRVLASVSAGVPLETVARAVAEGAMVANGADGATVTTIDGSQYTYVAAVGCVEPLFGRTRPLSGSFTGRVIEEARPCVFVSERAPGASRERASQDGIRSGIVVPIRVEGSPQGTVGVVSTRADAFTDECADILVAFSDLVALAVFLSDRHRARSQVSAYRSVLEALTSRASLGEVADAVSLCALRVLGADGSSVSRRDGDHLVYLSGAGSTRHLKNRRMPIDASFTGGVLDTRQPLIFDTGTASRESKRRARKDSVRSGIVVPIVVEDEAVGTVGVSSLSDDAFDSRDLDILLAFADYLGLGLTLVSKTEELTTQAAALARSNADLEEFAHVVSHDLKEPLHTIIAYGQILETSSRDLDERQRELIGRMRDVAMGMSGRLDALLRYSRVGQTELAIAETDLSAVIDEILANLAPSIEEHGVAIEVRRPMPRVVCDAVRVGEIFQNLIANAIKYNDKESPRLEIGWTQPEIGPIVFHVRDDGVGIKATDPDTVFRIFKRLHGSDRFGEGTGVGLTITRNVVERHGGQIWVETAHGAGSTFYFTLAPETAP